jgi:iron complex transport system substrate-binding protein
MKIRWYAALAVLLVLATLSAWALLRLLPEAAPTNPTAAAKGVRLVSLAPAVTETLYSIGAGEKLVGVSDYCDYPPEATRLPKLGTGITPNYEAIARLEPTLIVTEANVSSHTDQLRNIAPTRALPWLTLKDVVGSVRELGTLSGRSEAAGTLAERLEQSLGTPPPADGPRVLLVLGYAPGELREVWFIRKNSLHGAALHAAGARNAVERDIAGAPRLSLQELLAVDPDVIIILNRHARLGQALLDDFQKLGPLSAVKSGRISVLTSADPFANGPRILDFWAALRKELLKMSEPRQDGG